MVDTVSTEQAYGGLRIADVVELDVFRAAGAEVVSGEGDLDRVVRWAHVAEVLDIAPFLRGGELVLVSGVMLARGGAFRRFVDDLVEIGVAALVIEHAEQRTPVPPELVERARQRRLPVIVLHRPTRFIEITEEVHSAILDRQHGMLRRADRLAREFHSLLLDGAELREVVARLAQVVENPVVLEDAAHLIVEHASYRAPTAWLLDSWATHSRELHVDDDACLAMPITVRGEVWGQLHVVHLDSPLDGIVRVAVDRAAAAIGLSLLSERDSTQRRNVARSELIGRIRRQRDLPAAEALAQASALGADLGGRPLVGLALGAPLDSVAPGELLESLRSAATELGAIPLSGVDDGRVLALLGTLPGIDPCQQAAQVAEAVRAAHPDAGVRAGVSDQHDDDRVGAALEQAIEALRYAPPTRPITQIGEVGLSRLLAHLDDEALLPRFVERELGEVLAADARRGSDLLGTLRAFLDANGNRAETARALHLGRSGVYKRLDRLQSLLPRDLDDGRSRAMLYAALEGLDVLGRRAIPG